MVRKLQDEWLEQGIEQGRQQGTRRESQETTGRMAGAGH